MYFCVCGSHSESPSERRGGGGVEFQAALSLAMKIQVFKISILNFPPSYIMDQASADSRGALG